MCANVCYHFVSSTRASKSLARGLGASFFQSAAAAFRSDGATLARVSRSSSLQEIGDPSGFFGCFLTLFGCDATFYLSLPFLVELLLMHSRRGRWFVGSGRLVLRKPFICRCTLAWLSTHGIFSLSYLLCCLVSIFFRQFVPKVT